MNMIEETAVDCPWCGAHNDLLVERTEGEDLGIRDCSACCSPMVLRVRQWTADGVIVEAERADG